jgi:hypothetical protein
VRQLPDVKRPLRLVGAFALALFVAGCGTSRPAGGSAEGETREEQLKRIEADFHPSELDPDAPALEAGAGQHGVVQAADTAGATQVNMELEQGFRVQLYSTPSIDEAKAKKEEAEGIFPGEWFYTEYDAPTYKIRMGNFKNRFDADRFARLLVEKGFSDSWAVPSRVYKNPGVRPVSPGDPK